MPMLNTNRLEGKVGGVWVMGTPTKRTAKGDEYRCPACASNGGDEGGQHLIVFNERGTFACAAYPGDRKHRKEIWDVYRDWETDRKSTRLNSSHSAKSRMPSSA